MKRVCETESGSVHFTELHSTRFYYFDLSGLPNTFGRRPEALNCQCRSNQEKFQSGAVLDNRAA